MTRAAMRAADGDQNAAHDFVRLTQPDVWRLCRHLSSSSTGVDDLVQESYVRAFAALPKFAGRSSARTWLLSIARRACADDVRARVRQRSLRLDADGPARDAASIVEARLSLDALDPARREAFVLTQLIGLSYAEAADVCRCPIGTIRSRVARARDDLIALHGGDRRRAAK